MREWEEMIDRVHSRNKTVKIALCGKYVKLHDAYSFGGGSSRSCGV